MSMQRITTSFLISMGFISVTVWDADEVSGTEDALCGIDSRTRNFLVFPGSMTEDDARQKIVDDRRKYEVMA